MVEKLLFEGVEIKEGVSTVDFEDQFVVDVFLGETEEESQVGQKVVGLSEFNIENVMRVVFGSKDLGNWEEVEVFSGDWDGGVLSSEMFGGFEGA